MRFFSSFFLVGTFAVLFSGVALAQVPTGVSGGDWEGIQQAYQANRHRVVAVETGHRAENPGQGWLTNFDERGFLVEPRSADWSWGLELLSYGFEKSLIEVSGEANVVVDGGRIVYAWDENVEEWCVNDRRGLEHGFTLQERPVGIGGSLVFEMAVRGNLQAEVQKGGNGLRFLDQNGSIALTYSGLRVFDALGKDLEAGFVGSGRSVRIVIDVAEAVYPLTVDPIAQGAYLKASNTGAYDHFGVSVAILGDLIVVGAPGEDSDSSGVNGDGANDSALDSGAAYVFRKVAGIWSQEAFLKASNPDMYDSFGSRVAISVNRVVIGAGAEESLIGGVNGDQSDNGGLAVGAAYVFAYAGGAWVQEAYLKALYPDAHDQFGAAVAISGDRILVGANAEDSNGMESDNSLHDVGAAYVFRYIGGSWIQEAYLKASNFESNDRFGGTVAISGERLLVGATRESSNSTGVNGDGTNNSSPGSGAAYAFALIGGAWVEDGYLKASNTGSGDQFGYSIGLDGGLAVVSAKDERSASTGVNGNELDNSAANAGAAYIFRDVGGAWVQEAYLKASNTESDDNFGFSVAASDNRVVVGSWLEDSGAVGVDGDGSDNSQRSSGAAYVFGFDGTDWIQVAYLKASNTGGDDYFGFSVAISGGQVLVGAWQEDSGSTGVNGDEVDNSVTEAGAAYLFDLGLKERGHYMWVWGHLVPVTGTPVDADYVQVDGGTDFSLALRGDGSIFAWGIDTWGQISDAPQGGGFTQIAAGWWHGTALRLDGTLVSWGRDSNGQVISPPTTAGFTSVASGGDHSLALRADGSIAAWGVDNLGQVSNRPMGTGFLQVSGGGRHSLALQADGSIVSWGRDVEGQVLDTPIGTGFTQVEGGAFYSLALRADGSIVAWGDDQFGQVSNVPQEVGFVDVSGGNWHAMALRGDGTIMSWGTDFDGAVSLTPSARGYTQIAGGVYHSLALGPEPIGARYCDPAVTNSSGAPGSLGAFGSVAVAENLVILSASSLPINQFGFFLNGTASGLISMPGGSAGHLCVSASIGRYNRNSEIFFTGPRGKGGLTLDLNDTPTPSGRVSVVAGETWYFQGWFRDTVNMTSNFTNGVQVVFE